jgi:AcrR family transcriptional regulator
LTDGSEGGDFTVKQVAERAEVALQTFYRYFASKDALLLAMFEESIAQGMRTFFAETAGAPPVDRLRHLVLGPFHTTYDDGMRRRMRWRSRERERLRAAFPESVEAVHQPYRMSLVAAIEAARDAGDVEVEDPGLVADVLTHVVERLVLGASQDARGGRDLAASGEVVWQLVWQGIGTPRSRRRRR